MASLNDVAAHASNTVCSFNTIQVAPNLEKYSVLFFPVLCGRCSEISGIADILHNLCWQQLLCNNVLQILMMIIQESEHTENSLSLSLAYTANVSNMNPLPENPTVT
jgi:hypothetical protein